MRDVCNAYVMCVGHMCVCVYSVCDVWFMGVVCDLYGVYDVSGLCGLCVLCDVCNMHDMCLMPAMCVHVCCV